LIFISEKPVTLMVLQKVLPELKKSDIKDCLDEVLDEWNNLDRGFKLHEIANGYQFRTNSEFSEYLIKFKQSKPFKLSRAALEALAIIAYKQPVTRIEVDQIRGVDSSGVVSLLLEKRLIEIKGRREVIGRPFLYATTNEFLETFGLKSIADLPTLKELEEIDSSIQQTLQGIEV
jgi:segregation and condensation protein B